MEIICSDPEEKDIRLMDLKPGDIFKFPEGSRTFMLLHPKSFMDDRRITFHRSDRLCVDFDRKIATIIDATAVVVPYHGLLEIWKKER